METSALYTLLAGLGSALLVAMLMGLLFDRFRLPPVLAQILGGFLVGSILFPALEGIIHEGRLHLPDFTNATFEVTGTLGLIMLMFISGLEVREDELLRAGKKSLITAIGGFVFPLGAGLFLGYLFDWDLRQGLVLGLIMAPTSIGITAVTLVELNRLRTKVGVVLMGAAIMDDVMVIVAASVILTKGGVVMLFVKIVAFFLLIWVLGKYLMPRSAVAGYKLPLKGGGTAFVIIMCIFAALLAESFKVALVTGAFLTGMFLASCSIKERILQDVEIIATSFFIPIFFFLVGIKIETAALMKSGLLLALVIPVSMLTKIGGGFLGAWISGLKKREAFIIGIGAAPRLEFPIIIALLATMNSVFGKSEAQELFGMTMGMVAFSIIITPLLLRWVYAGDKEIVEVHDYKP